MFPTKYLPLVALLLLLSAFQASGDNVLPSKCDTSCQPPPAPSPPLSGYPSYGAPPTPIPPSGYSIFSSPPPPAGQSKCPPAGAGVQCCTPPAAYTYAPPSPYTYVPYGEAENSAPRLLLPILAPLIMLFSSFIFLF